MENGCAGLGVWRIDVWELGVWRSTVWTIGNLGCMENGVLELQSAV